MSFFKMFGEGILEAIISFLLFIDSIVYSLISYVYQIFLVLVNGSNIFDKSLLNGFMERIYLILGVVMLFVVAYSLLKSMVNPDEALKGKESPTKFIWNIVGSVVLIALLPTVFEFAYDLQNSVLRYNTIGRLILGSSLTDDDELSNTIDSGGFMIASSVFQSFVHVKDGEKYCTTLEEEQTKTHADGSGCEILTVSTLDFGGWEALRLIPGGSGILNGIESIASFLGGGTSYGQVLASVSVTRDFFRYGMLSEAIVEGNVTYYFLISSAVGIFVLFVIVSYVIDMALRLVKLAVYELIAPLPILARIVPNEQAKKIFSNWLKATISTFLEVFIRIALLFFAVLLINTVVFSINDFFAVTLKNVGSARIDIILIAQCMVIVGIVLFIKQAPAIIKEITGLDGGKYGKSFMRGIGMMTASIGGGTTATVRSFVNDKDRPMMQRVRRAFTAGVGANARGLWHGSKVQKFSEIPKQTGVAASHTLAHRSEIDAAGGRKEYYKNTIVDKVKDVQAWASGSFEVQQQQLNTVNAFFEDAKNVKSTSEGLVREKKFLFKYGSNKTFNHNGRSVTVDSDTSLSAMQAMIESLKSSGNVDDANLADQLNNEMEKRIKEIGKAIVTTSVDPATLSRSTFDATYMSGTNKLEDKAATVIAETKNAYELVQKRYVENGSLDAVLEFKKPTTPGGPANTLRTDNVSDLADQLKIQSSNIQRNIKLEQERRKAKEKK